MRSIFVLGFIEIDSEPAVTVDQGENINLSYNIAFVRDRVSCELTSKSISLQTFNLNSRRRCLFVVFKLVIAFYLLLLYIWK